MSDSSSWPPEGQESTPLFWQGRLIGKLSSEGTWHKVIAKANQWSYKHDAPGLQAMVWDATRPRVSRVEVFHKPSGCTFWLNADDFDRFAIHDTLNSSDGEQLFVNRRHWHVMNPNGQLGLWDAQQAP